MSGEKNSVQYPSGVKWTRQRKCVYDILREASERLSAVQIYQCIVKTGEEAGYAVSTVYRILAAFEEKGLVIRDT